MALGQSEIKFAGYLVGLNGLKVDIDKILLDYKTEDELRYAADKDPSINVYDHMRHLQMAIYPFRLPVLFCVFPLLTGPPLTELPLLPLVPDPDLPRLLPLDPLPAGETPLVVVDPPLVEGVMALPDPRGWGPVEPRAGVPRLLLLC